MYYGWINGFYAMSDAKNAGESAHDARQSAQRAQTAAQYLKDCLDRQALILRSLLTLCERKGMFDEPEFREIMNEIDLSDGRLDGKLKRQPAPRECAACGKKNGKRAIDCMYCGERLPDGEIL